MDIQVSIVEPVFQAETIDAAECHASTLVSLPNHNYLCTWFAGSKEGRRDVGIWLSYRQAGRWSPPEQIVKVSQEAHWNPVLFVDDGTVYLFFKVGASPQTWRTYWMRCSAQELHWSNAQELVPGDVGGRGPVKNKPIKLANGDWLAPASIETDTAWTCFVDRSCDGGITWRRSKPISQQKSTPASGDSNTLTGGGIIQPTLWRSDDNHVHMLTRSTAGRIYRADSHDSGYTWSSAYPTEMPNNNSGIDLVRLNDNRLILAYNPVSENWGPRTPLKLTVSSDNGVTWQDCFVLEDEAGEYSYPAIVKTDLGLAVSYTWQRRCIQFWEFTHLYR